MTVRESYEAVLIELDKVNAPTFLLEDFNYYLNKAIQQYINKRYSLYDINQQTTDDLETIKTTTILTPSKISSENFSKYQGFYSLYSNVYEVLLPEDYLHMLSCICIYRVKRNKNCNVAGSYLQYPARRLKTDSWGQITINYYNAPSPEVPYYYIHNLNQKQNPLTNSISIGRSEVKQLPQVRMEIRYGQDDGIFELTEVLIDYLKIPQKVQLTQEQLDLVEDTSQILEFQDYVCKEIINELVMLVMEGNSDPRLQTYIPVSQSIVSLTQQQQNKN